MVKIRPYGTWKSPITSDLIVAETIGITEVRICDDSIYWLELRPLEEGRSVVVRRSAGEPIEDVTPPPWSARTRVHEYGGGAFTVHKDIVFFTNFADQRIYRQHIGGEPEPMTPDGDMRYADMVVAPDAPDGNGMVAVREDHTTPGQEAVNSIVWLDTNRMSEGKVLVDGGDFYSSPRLNGEGTRLAWLTWNHPQMPWDGTELWVADLGPGGTLANSEKVAGGPKESVFQPEWSPDGILAFVSDRTGWWNLYRWNGRRVEALCPMPAEFGQPQWVFGLATYGFESARSVITAYQESGRSHLARLDTDSGRLQPLSSPYTKIGKIDVGGGSVVCNGGSPERMYELARIDLVTGDIEVVRRSSSLVIDSAYLSTPEVIEFPTENGLTAYAFFYPPQNDDFAAPEGESPPLLAVSHGGPTHSTETVLAPPIQYWTSRGIAVVDVNYGGSTGYGRPYRERLKGQWGVVDVADCVNAAKYLMERGRVDPARVAIRGGSAGGYTTLAALTFHDLFKAGASYYGVSDLETLARDTHKFESRYLDSLIGPYPEEMDLYKARSPIHHVDRLTCPIIFFQGLEDKVVPPNQAKVMFDAVRKAGFPTAYVVFEGEEHGFRKAQNIKRALDAELYFYGRVFGFEPADDVEPVRIENMPG